MRDPAITLQEWLGHRDLATTQRYADYAPGHREAELIEAAFGSDSGSRTLCHRPRRRTPQRPDPTLIRPNWYLIGTLRTGERRNPRFQAVPSDRGDWI